MAFRARLAALYLSGWLCVFRQSGWGKTEAMKTLQGALHGAGAPHQFWTLEVREGHQASKDFLGNSGISAVPGLRAYGHLPKDVSPGYSILLLTAK